MSKDSDLKNLSREQLLELAQARQVEHERLCREMDRLRSGQQTSSAELVLIKRVSDVLRTTEGLEQLAVSLVEVVISELSADFVCLMLTGSQEKELTPAAVFHRHGGGPRPVAELKRDECVPLDQGDLGRAMKQGEVLMVESLEEGGLTPWPGILPRRAQSLIALPLLARGQVLGAMILASLSPASFDQGHSRTLGIICGHAASALFNHRLIHELGQANERLRASERDATQAREHLQHLFDTASDVIIITGQDGNISYVNQAAADLGLDPPELQGRPLKGLFSEPEKAAMLIESPLRHSEEMAMELPGGQRLVLMSTTPLPESREFMAILRDITQRKVLERQLLHAEKLASVGVLAAGVAHEIGNPLAAISGYAQIMAKGQTPAEECGEFAQSIYSQAERINKIIRELLDYSRPSPYQARETRVNQAIESVLGMFFTQKRLRQYKLDISRDLARDLPPVKIDRDQLQQVVLNLVMNAAQAMEAGGKLVITTRKHKGLVAIDFSDTGPGIEPEKLPLVFDPFFTTKPVGQGTGLGLSICHRIISQAGGRITVESQPGRGARFTVWLPAGG